MQAVFLCSNVNIISALLRLWLCLLHTESRLSFEFRHLLKCMPTTHNAQKLQHDGNILEKAQANMHQCWIFKDSSPYIKAFLLLNPPGVFLCNFFLCNFFSLYPELFLHSSSQDTSSTPVTCLEALFVGALKWKNKEYRTSTTEHC